MWIAWTTVLAASLPLLQPVWAEDELEAEPPSIERGHGYLLALPATRDKLRPLLIALHGTDSSTERALAAWAEAAKEADLYLLCPGPKAKNWDLKADKPRVLALVHLMKEKHRVDPERVYLSGFSAGATMASIVLQSEPSLFAAGALLSGHFARGAETGFEANPRTAIRIVHGKRDRAFSPSTAAAFAERLRGQGHVVTYTEVPELGHEYPREPQMRQVLSWLLSFQRSSLRRPRP